MPNTRLKKDQLSTAKIIMGRLANLPPKPHKEMKIDKKVPLAKKAIRKGK